MTSRTRAVDHPFRRAPARARIALVALAVALVACASTPDDAGAGAPTAPGCSVDLLVQFSPAVARPSSAGFLRSLVAGSGYDLRYVRTLGKTLLVRLTGPDTSCDGGIALLRRNTLVKSLDVDERQFRHPVEQSEAP